MVHGNSPTDEQQQDAELAKLVVEQKLATQEEVDRCLQAHRSAQDPRNQSLADVMVVRGVVTKGQIDRIKTTLEASRGQQIPGYQILAKLGAGAMATVFKARQLSLDRLVAIKVLPKRYSQDTDYVERFYKEGKAAAKLNHANIVQAIDVGEAGGYHYFVMEYVEGHTLHDELVKGKGFSEAEALRIITQIARALAHAHERGLIHRDVKPKNIMITKDGVAKLADMGLARVATDVQAAQAEAGRAFGTPYYISPEQIRGELDIDFRADIYSLGATFYHLVTGRLPFDAPSPVAVMQKHLKEPLIPPDHVNTKLSAGVGEVVEVMMAKDHRMRYASTSDLILDLEAIAAGEPPLQARRHIDDDVLTGLRSDASPEVPAKPAVRERYKNLILYVIALGAALVISMIVNLMLLVLGWGAR
ncbi:MAG: serine/threonine protein kinase [Phycisphaerae bacterium]|nr:serine/threonine protein kinase [Phycisphaerae bacterium]